MWPNTLVYAAKVGRVVRVERSQANHPGFFNGNFVEVEHPDGTRAQYAHLNGAAIGVEVGDTVTPGQPFARSGLSGRTLYPHLHFQLTGSDGTPRPSRFKDAPGDPLRFFDSVCAQKP